MSRALTSRQFACVCTSQIFTKMVSGLFSRIEFSDGVASQLRRAAVGFASLLAACLIPDTYGQDSSQEGKKSPQSQVDRASEFAGRKTAIYDFRKKLALAQTPEEKRTVVEEFRTKNEAFSRAQRIAPVDEKSSSLRMAELKVKAQGNPEMLARLDAMESRLASVETIKAKLAEAQTATGEQKVRLQEDIRREQTKLIQLQQQAAPSRLGEASARSAESTKELPPEMAAMKAKSEARRQELDQLREALTKASPQERQKLLDAWREKRMQETSARTLPSAQ